MTKDQARSINGMELICHIPEYPSYCNIIVLAKEGVGVSFKPLYKTAKEKQDVIEAVATTMNCSTEEAENIVNRPDYCFGSADSSVPFDVIKQIINDIKRGIDITYEEYVEGHAPSCLFV